MHTSTIRVYLAGINFITKLLTGSPHPFSSHPHVTLLLKGFKRQEPHCSPSRQALTSQILSDCIAILRSGYANPHIDATLESMFLLAFYGFLRCSEFTASNSRFNPALHACLSDLSIANSTTLIFTLRHSKTDQFGVSTPIYLFKLNSPLSPYEPLVRHLSTRIAQHASPSDPLFVTEAGSVITRTWFHHHLRLVLTKAGYAASHFSGHSFRIGATSTASRQGIPEHTIKILGRWTSQAYHAYIRTSPSDLLQAHAALAQ